MKEDQSSGRAPNRPEGQQSSGRAPNRPEGQQSSGRAPYRPLTVKPTPRRQKTPLRDLTTFGNTHAVRHPDCDYGGEIDIHVVICAWEGQPFRDRELAVAVCRSVEVSCRNMGFRLYGYCLMPDRLHVLLSPAESEQALAGWLRNFKSFTTNWYQKHGGKRRLWQESAFDHICRTGETAECVLAYIVENPLRGGLVKDWKDWAWTGVFIDI